MTYIAPGEFVVERVNLSRFRFQAEIANFSRIHVSRTTLDRPWRANFLKYPSTKGGCGPSACSYSRDFIIARLRRRVPLSAIGWFGVRINMCRERTVVL